MCSPVDLQCQASNAAESAFEKIATSAGQAAAQMIGEALTWWVRTPSVSPDSDTVRGLQYYTMPVVGIVLVGSIFVQAIRMILSRKKDPLINVSVGLIRYAVTVAVGLSALGLCLRAGDLFAQYLIDQAIPDFANRMKGLFTLQIAGNSFTLLLLGLSACLIAAIQWVLGFLRQAGILVLAVMLPLAASGSINESTKGWLNKIIPWLVSLVFYKPMAALIYNIGFTLLGAGQDFSTVMTGIVVLALAVIAMPAMLKFFGWMNVSASGGGVAGVAAGGAMGALAVSQLASRGGAVQSAASMERSGPGSDGPPPGSAPSGTPTGSDPTAPDSGGSAGSPDSAGAPGAGGAPGAVGQASGSGAGGSVASAGPEAAAGSATAAAGAAEAGMAAGPPGAVIAAGTQAVRGAAEGAADQVTDGGQHQ